MSTPPLYDTCRKYLENGEIERCLETLIDSFANSQHLYQQALLLLQRYQANESERLSAIITLEQYELRRGQIILGALNLLKRLNSPRGKYRSTRIAFFLLPAAAIVFGTLAATGIVQQKQHQRHKEVTLHDIRYSSKSEVLLLEAEKPNELAGTFQIAVHIPEELRDVLQLTGSIFPIAIYSPDQDVTSISKETSAGNDSFNCSLNFLVNTSPARFTIGIRFQEIPRQQDPAQIYQKIGEVRFCPGPEKKDCRALKKASFSDRVFSSANRALFLGMFIGCSVIAILSFLFFYLK